MDEKILIGIASAFIGILGTYLVAILKHRKDLEFKYDTDLRDKRITQYLELWKLLQDLAKYARPKQLNYEDLGNLSAPLRQWYFEKGGLFLSDRSRDAYFALQDAIRAVLTVNTEPPGALLSDEVYEPLRIKGSELRTALTQDVGTRKRLKLN